MNNCLLSDARVEKVETISVLRASSRRYKILMRIKDDDFVRESCFSTTMRTSHRLLSLKNR